MSRKRIAREFAAAYEQGARAGRAGVVGPNPGKPERVDPLDHWVALAEEYGRASNYRPAPARTNKVNGTMMNLPRFDGSPTHDPHPAIPTGGRQ